MKRKSLMIFSLMIIGLFMISSMLPLVSAYTPGVQFDGVSKVLSDTNSNTVTNKVSDTATNIWDKIKAGLENLFGGDGVDRDNPFANTFARILMIFIVTVLVYTILDFIGIFPEGSGTKNMDWVKWVVSVGVGILAFLFVDVDMISNLSMQYEALGVTLTAVLPAIIILVFAFKIKAKAIEGDRDNYVSTVISSGVLWIYLIYMLSFLIGKNRIPSEGNSLIKLIYWVIVIVLLSVIIFGNYIVRQFTKKELINAIGNELGKTNKNQMAWLTARAEDIAEKWSNAKTSNVKASLASQYNHIIDRLKEMGAKNLPKKLSE